MKLIPGYEAYSVTEQGVIYSHKKTGGKGKGKINRKCRSYYERKKEEGKGKRN